MIHHAIVWLYIQCPPRIPKEWGYSTFLSVAALLSVLRTGARPVRSPVEAGR